MLVAVLNHDDPSLQYFFMPGAVVTSLSLTHTHTHPYDAAVHVVLLKSGVAAFLNTRR